MARRVTLGLLSLLYFACGSAQGDGGAEGADNLTAHTPSPQVAAAANACADAIDGIPAAAWHTEGHVDSMADASISKAFRTCLSSYVQIRTVNPRTADDVGEIAAADFFAGIYSRLGVPTRTTPLSKSTVPDDPQRMSLIATFKGRRPDGSVILLNHTDVVPATGTWTHAPFSGEDDGNFIWGRGSLDMKSTGLMQLLSIAILKKAGVVLEHDVHFAAVADEEVGGRGSELIAVGHIDDDGSPEQIDPLGLKPGVVLNEGGTGIRDALLPGRDAFVIGSEEKGVVWTQFAHADPKALVHALARTSVLAAPKSDGLASSSDQENLKTKCKVAGMISDETQKTNVQARLSKVTLDCDSGTEGAVRSALAGLAKSFDLTPNVTITNAPAGGRDHIDVAIEYGNGGHGSAPEGSTALDVAVAVLISTGQLDAGSLRADSGVEDRLFKYGLSPANQTLFNTLARSQGETAESLAEIVTSKPGLSGVLLGLADSHLPTTAPFKNTCSWTAFKFPADGEARAKFDCRVTFDTKANDLEQSLAKIVAADGVVLRTDRAACFDCYKQEFNQSSTDTPQYKVLARALEKSTPAAFSSPYLFPGSSDTFFFRRAGIPTYGFMPASVSEDVLKTFHAIDERVPVDVLVPSVHVYTEVVYRLANGIAPTPADDAHRLDNKGVSCRARSGSDGSFRWDAPVDRLACEGSLYLCTRSGSAPRFVSAVPDENDAEVESIARLKDGYNPDGVDPSEIPDAVEAQLFTPRQDSSRVFLGQPFEIDTGAGASRSFLVRCDTPLQQQLATLFTRSKVHFYSE
jgi:acetylornithine deacetylase/succinyl-diaminopimelate desuccinylase-like protein